jgi:dTDP-D-glucose 4,6-dehydratase
MKKTISTKPSYSILGAPVSIPNTIKWIQGTRIVKNQVPIQQILTANMAGKNSSLNVYFFRTIEITNFQLLARYHNIYGPEGTWDGGREKAPAAICRKIAKLPIDGGEIEVWGDGLQTRSFLFIDECIEATRRLMQSNFTEPINIGSEEMVTINQLIEIVANVSGKKVTRKHKLDAPTGVRGRNSSNDLIRRVLNWDYEVSLKEGLEKTYTWIDQQEKLINPRISI